MSAPRLELRLDRLARNAATLVARLGDRGIGVTAVTKATNKRMTPGAAPTSALTPYTPVTTDTVNSSS